jgi:hypothetical protein
MTQTMTVPEPRPADPVVTPATDPPALDLGALIADLTAQTAPVFEAMEWAEEEIKAARRRHRRQADTIHHAFGVLAPREIGPGMGTEFVYRGHVRELLERVGAGADLRPATAAEICLALVETSLQAPMHGPAAGLYFRMWQQAFPDSELTAEFANQQGSYEQLHGSRIDELEADLRHRLRDPDRQLGDITCAGLHHGKQVTCTFACP